MLDLRRVAHFIDVAQTGSLTRTGLQLDVSHSILSREIHDLEAELGHRLFHRTGRGMKLTEFGRQLLPRAQRLIIEASRLSDEASTLRGRLAGTVSIGLPGSVTALIAGSLLELTRTKYPDLFLRFVDAISGGIEELLASGRIDLGVFYTGAAETQRGDIPLTVSRLYLIGPPGDPVTSKPFVTLADVARCSLVLPSRPGGVRAIVEDAASRRGHRIRIACEIDSLLAVKQLIAGGGSYTVSSMEAIATDVHAGRLQAAAICHPELTRTLVMNLAPKQSLTLAARAVSELVPVATEPLLHVGHWKAPAAKTSPKSFGTSHRSSRSGTSSSKKV